MSILSPPAHDIKNFYRHYPDSGGSFKVQVYSPFIVLNKTGLPFYVRPSRSTRVGVPTDIAGDTRPGPYLAYSQFVYSLMNIKEVLAKPLPFSECS